jgi:hypothetical protein
MGDIENILEQHGPARSSLVAEALQKEFGLAPATARKRLSRIKAPIHRFPVPLLPKKEAFLYHAEQRKTERFWTISCPPSGKLIPSMAQHSTDWLHVVA